MKNKKDIILPCRERRRVMDIVMIYKFCESTDGFFVTGFKRD